MTRISLDNLKIFLKQAKLTFAPLSHSHNKDDIKNIVDPIQSDYNEDDENALSFIKNKPILPIEKLVDYGALVSVTQKVDETEYRIIITPDMSPIKNQMFIITPPANTNWRFKIGYLKESDGQTVLLSVLRGSSSSEFLLVSIIKNSSGQEINLQLLTSSKLFSIAYDANKTYSSSINSSVVYNYNIINSLNSMLKSNSDYTPELDTDVAIKKYTDTKVEDHNLSSEAHSDLRGKVEEQTEMISNLSSLVNTHKYMDWSSKKVAIIGDSITEKNSRTSKNYHDYISEKTGISVLNLGVSGTGFKNGESNNKAYYQRVLSISWEEDDDSLVLLVGSFNDLSSTLNAEIGNVTDSTTNTLSGCINITIDNLFQSHPLARLGVITPTPWQNNKPNNTNAENYVNAIINICKRRGIPYLDLFHSSGLRPWDENYRKLVYSKDNGNGIHPNEIGHAVIASLVEPFISSLINYSTYSASGTLVEVEVPLILRNAMCIAKESSLDAGTAITLVSGNIAYKVSNPVDISDAKMLKISAWAGEGYGYFSFFDENESLLQCSWASATGSIENQAVPIPDNAKTIIIAGNSNYVLPKLVKTVKQL